MKDMHTSLWDAEQDDVIILFYESPLCGTHREHRGLEQLFTALSHQLTRSVVVDWTAYGRQNIERT